MARIVIGLYMVRYPLGGMLDGQLQWIAGLRRLGHEVTVVERATYPNACFDPSRGMMTDDCSYGFAIVDGLLRRFGVEQGLCFADVNGDYHGMSRREVERLFASADLFIDFGTHGAWLEEAARCRIRVLVDGEPGWTQMRLELRRRDGEQIDEYDAYFTVGRNIGTDASHAPTAGLHWRHVFHPVVIPLWHAKAFVQPDSAYTTVMNWQAHEPLVYGGRIYGQKDLEFERFIDLPSRVLFPLELAVAGKNAPLDELRMSGWRLSDAHAVTHTVESFENYVASSRGEFSVCKNVFVATHSGWFSDRSAAYLACGRPVVLQDTGFSEHLPTGEGLFAVKDVDGAAGAIEEVEGDWDRHSRAARRIALEYLSTDVVLRDLLMELGL